MPLLPRDLPARLRYDGYVGVGHEPQGGVLQLRVMSVQKIQRYIPGADEVLISIRSHGALAARVPDGWVDILFLAFDDTGALAAPASAARGMTPSDATAVLRFVRRNRQRRRLVIQCEAGVSRSRSLASAVAQVLQLPYRWTVLNDGVFDLVCREAALATPR